MKLSFHFLWYDLWVGAFWDRAKRVLYVAPLPCCVLKFEFARRCSHCNGYGHVWVMEFPVGSHTEDCPDCDGTGRIDP